MEVRPGYKQTELGMIPQDWEVRRLSAHFRIYAGGDVPKHSHSKTQSAAHPYPIFANALQNKGLYGYTAERRSSANSVTITARGCLGHAEYRGQPFFPIVRLLVMEPTGKLDARYTAYAVNARVKFSIESTGVPQLTAPQVGKYSLAAPPTEAEQRAIATALSDVDALLVVLDRLIAKKHNLKQAAMQQLLTGQTRLPGFGETRAFVSDELGMRPPDWDVIPLKELVDPSRGIRYGIVQPGAYDSNGRFMIRGQDYSEAKGWAQPADVFRVSDAVERRYRSARVQHGDLIMTIVGYCGHVEIVPEWLDGANLTQTTARIAIQPDKASQVFCKYLLQSAVGKNQVASFLKGAAQPGLNCGDVEKFRLPLPTMREQNAIAEILSDIDGEISALEARRDKTRNLKQAMMQELLTGRTRLV